MSDAMPVLDAKPACAHPVTGPDALWSELKRDRALDEVLLRALFAWGAPELALRIVARRTRAERRAVERRLASLQ